MSQMDRQIRWAQRRLWMNRWLTQVTWCVGVAAALVAVILLVQRSAGLILPMLWIAAGLIVTGVFVSVVWLVRTRETPAVAAARLDHAAGLRERISSGQYCRSIDDPFAKAVVTDAERISTKVSARQHIRLTTPRPLAGTCVAMLVALLMLLVPFGWLASTDARSTEDKQVESSETKLTVRKRLDSLVRMAEENPALNDLDGELDKLKQDPSAKLDRPMDIRHDAVKKIDNLADAVRSKREDEKYDRILATRKMLRGLQVPDSESAPTQKLSKALAKGDFKAAQEEVKKVQEQLATMKGEQDKETVEQLSKQLKDLSEQLEKLAKNEQLAEKLAQAGIKKEDIERMMENLKKEDLDQVKQQLQEKGMSQQQIQQLAQQLKQQQTQSTTAKQLSQQMSQASKCNSPGQMGDAMAGLSQAGQMLSELEQLEQEMSQLDSMMAELENSKNDLGSSCSQCNGSGQNCSSCGGNGNKPGSGMGKRPGQGQGGLAPEQQTDVAFKVQRGKVRTTKGAIIGQFLVDGEQAKGEVTKDFVELIAASERDASDAVSRDRVPRPYQRAVKGYFSTVEAMTRKDASDDDDATPTDDEGSAEETDEGSGEE